MQATPALQILNDDKENRKLVAKLPYFMMTRWARIVADWRESKKSFLPFHKFVEFVQREAKIANDPVLSFQSLKEESTKVERAVRTENKLKSSRSFSTETTEIPAKDGRSKTKSKCRMCDKDDHTIDTCQTFLALTLEGRK